MSKANASAGAEYLHNPVTGRTFPSTPELLKRGDLIACTKADGSDAKLVLNDPANSGDAPKTKYLRNKITGRILLYNPVLAKSHNMVPYYGEDEEAAAAPDENVLPESAEQAASEDEGYVGDPDTPAVEDEGADDENEIEVDLDSMTKKQMQTFIKETYGKHIDLRKVKTEKAVRELATSIIESSDPL